MAEEKATAETQREDEGAEDSLVVPCLSVCVRRVGAGWCAYLMLPTDHECTIAAAEDYHSAYSACSALLAQIDDVRADIKAVMGLSDA